MQIGAGLGAILMCLVLVGICVCMDLIWPQLGATGFSASASASGPVALFVPLSYFIINCCQCRPSKRRRTKHVQPPHKNSAEASPSASKNSSAQRPENSRIENQRTASSPNTPRHHNNNNTSHNTKASPEASTSSDPNDHNGKNPNTPLIRKQSGPHHPPHLSVTIAGPSPNRSAKGTKKSQ